MKKHLAAIISIFMLTSMISCGSTKKEDSDKESSSRSEYYKISPEELTGNVSMIVRPGQVDTVQKSVIDPFLEQHPNVTVELVGYEGDLDQYLSAKAASGDLPDIVDGYLLPYSLSQGLVMPLDEFVENDPDFDYISKALYSDFIINDKLFALPYKLTFNGVILNLSLLESLNLPKPGYDWTLDEFKDLSKKSTNNTYSGTTGLAYVDEMLMGMIDADLSQCGYNPKTGKFDFTSGTWKEAMSYIKELREIPGLVGNLLRNQALRDEGKQDDYQKKFGENADGFMDGKILSHACGSWDFNGLRPEFEHDFYPLPSKEGVGPRDSTHVDFLFMTTAIEEENEAAAFALMKWFSYHKDGVKTLLELREEQEEPMPYFQIPATNHPEVSEYFNSIDRLPDGLKYMYNNMDNALRADVFKFMPSYNTILSEIVKPTISAVFKGEQDALSIAAELEKKANEALEEAQNKLKEDMSQFELYQ